MYSLAQLKVLARSIHTATDQVHACRRHATARESCSRSMYRECGAVRARRGVSAPRRERVAVRARRGCCRRHVFTRERAVPTVCVARAMRRESAPRRNGASASRRERVSARVGPSTSRDANPCKAAVAAREKWRGRSTRPRSAAAAASRVAARATLCICRRAAHLHVCCPSRARRRPCTRAACKSFELARARGLRAY